MPWQEVTVMSQRFEFVALAQKEGANMARLCRRFGISRKTGYKWLRRFNERGVVALIDQSRRPHHSPGRTAQRVEDAILRVRDKHPVWGARKVRARLERLGWSGLPSPSTITAILRRYSRIDDEEAEKHRAWQRFEAEMANDLWQMDFKGHFAMSDGRCHPLTVLDDHSRFAVAVRACDNERGETVQDQLTYVFRGYGLPRRLLVDNGSPWGSDDRHPYTPLIAWLIRLGIKVIHSRPYHPQTAGKEERFHRTLKAEVIGQRLFRDLTDCQVHFDVWRNIYNFERPHEALGMAVPASRYRESPREFPKELPPIEYGPDDVVRKVQKEGQVHFQGRVFRIPKAFLGYPVAIRPTLNDGVFDIFFCQQKVAQIDLTEHNDDP
jgi:transposase InsO family protein